MSDFIPMQASIFGSTILCGIGMGAIYDSIRIFRRIIPHANIVIAIEDLIYWICCSILLFYVLYSKDDGVIRGFSILGVMIGLFVYYISISRVYLKSAVWILYKVKKFIFTIFKLLIMPIKVVYSFLKKIMNKPSKYLIKQLKKPVKQVKINKEKYMINREILKYERIINRDKKLKANKAKVIIHKSENKIEKIKK